MGARLVDTSPELSRLKEAVRGGLLVAGRDAAVAAATYQLETLTTQLRVRVGPLEGRAGPVVEIEAPDSAAAARDGSRRDREQVVEPITVAVPGGAAAESGSESQQQRGDRFAGNGHVIEGAKP